MDERSAILVAMLGYFSAARPRVQEALRAVLRDNSSVLSSVSGSGAKALERLEAFSCAGKTIRGCLVRLGFEIVAGADPRADGALDRVGAAMELFQSGFLVHDDIMDRDGMRRGMPTIHAAYSGDARDRGLVEPDHHGVSLGICAGDVAFFMGHYALATMGETAATLADPELKARVTAFACRELAIVGVAQMQDVENGAATGGSSGDPGVEAILTLYRYKTGRYTFSMPLAIGAMLAGAEPGRVAVLERIGEALGIVFQLKDDELGLYADSGALGKVSGSDLREDKKTLHRRLFLERARGRFAEAEAARLCGSFGARELSASDLDAVRAAVETSGVRSDVARIMRRYADEARTGFLSLGDTDANAARAFLALLDYSLTRGS